MTLRVPLAAVRDGELFGVPVSMDAEAIDSRGRESAVEAFIRDPQRAGPALLETRGLRARGKPPGSCLIAAGETRTFPRSS